MAQQQLTKETPAVQATTKPDLSKMHEIAGLWLPHGWCFSSGQSSITVGNAVSIGLITGRVERMFQAPNGLVWLEFERGEYMTISPPVYCQYGTENALAKARQQRR